ncbi:MAG TPA: DUF3047 domain-containing protein [Polyangiaceae bacterium]|nr:DUF3047 domain-containing protein [Polyangiaceae bacterium]
MKHHPYALAVFCLATSWSLSRDATAEAPRESPIALGAFKIVEKKSGPDNYYSVTPPPDAHIHAEYKPPFKTAVLGYQFPDDARRAVAGLRWSWRAVVLPKGGNECESGKGDSAAVVYVTWKRGLRWYTLKYVWSATGPKGRTCDSKRNPFVAQDTIIVDSGEPVGQWRTVHIVPDDEFRNHFEGGDPKASVPDLVGVGIMSDGDQTKSQSSADYRDFVVVLR